MLKRFQERLLLLTRLTALRSTYQNWLAGEIGPKAEPIDLRLICP